MIITAGESEDILSDGPIDIGDDNHISVIPDKDPRCACHDAGSGQGERDSVCARLQVELFQLSRCQPQCFRIPLRGLLFLCFCDFWGGNTCRDSRRSGSGGSSL